MVANSSARFFWARNSPKIRSLSTWNCLACWLPGQGNCWQPVQNERAKTRSADFGANPIRALLSRFDWLLFMVSAEGISTAFFKRNLDFTVLARAVLVNKIANLGKGHFSCLRWFPSPDVTVFVDQEVEKLSIRRLGRFSCRKIPLH